MAVNESDQITELSFQAILINMGIQLEKEEIVSYMKDINPAYKDEHIDYELFVRTIAMLL